MNPKYVPTPEERSKEGQGTTLGRVTPERLEFDPLLYNRRLEALFSAIGENVTLAPRRSQEIKEELLQRLREL